MRPIGILLSRLHPVRSYFSSIKGRLLLFYYLKVVYRNHQCVIIGMTEHMGDIVACLPVAENDYYENNNIVIWVANRRYADLIRSVKYISEVIEINCISSWAKIYQCLPNDNVIDLHFHNRYCARCNVYHKKRNFNDTINDQNYYNFGALMESFCMHAKVPLPKSRQPNLELRKSPKVKRLLQGITHPYVVVHTKSNETSRDWHYSEWKRLLNLLVLRFKLQVVEIGQQSTDISQEEGVITLADRNLTLTESAEVIQSANLFIGIDSGPAHLANALKVPGIILLGRYRAFDNYMPYTGFFEDPHNALILRSKSPLKDVKFASLEAQIANFIKVKLDKIR